VCEQPIRSYISDNRLPPIFCHRNLAHALEKRYIILYDLNFSLRRRARLRNMSPNFRTKPLWQIAGKTRRGRWYVGLGDWLTTYVTIGMPNKGNQRSCRLPREIAPGGHLSESMSILSTTAIQVFSGLSFKNCQENSDFADFKLKYKL